LFKSFDLKNIGVFVDEEGETVYQSFIFQTTWEHSTMDALLELRAQEDLRAFFIAPYDGGMDVIMKGTHTCWRFKRTFKDWLSKRPDLF
jgi:hypothetical protein